jgi:exodeoxyribonuclease III
VTYGIGIPKHDEEGRVITVEFKRFYLVDVYVPNSKRDLTRLEYRQKEWDVDFLKYLKKLEKKKPVVFCGDLNVAHKEIDLTYPKANVRSHGFTAEERAGFDNIIAAGFLDSFREFEKGPGHYTWWSQFNNCRTRNIGWRIDYFCISKSFRPHLKKAFILPKVIGSDHCPVGIEVDG